MEQVSVGNHCPVVPPLDTHFQHSNASTTHEPEHAMGLGRSSPVGGSIQPFAQLFPSSCILADPKSCQKIAPSLHHPLNQNRPHRTMRPEASYPSSLGGKDNFKPSGRTAVEACAARARWPGGVECAQSGLQRNCCPSCAAHRSTGELFNESRQTIPGEIPGTLDSKQELSGVAARNAEPA